MLRTKKGAALLQVLMVTVILAGLATMLLRVGLSRVSNARMTRRETVSKMLINACQTEVNALWSMKTPEVFSRDLATCTMYCPGSGDCSNKYVCSPTTIDGITYTVTAKMSSPASDMDGHCGVSYTIVDDTSGLDVIM